MSAVAVVDYGMCNLDSVARAVEECGGHPLVTRDPAALERSTHIILPGVGAFPDGMRNLRNSGLDVALTRQVRECRIPLLGICLGMQLLATRGWEGGETAGLNLIPGEVHRLSPTTNQTRIPHIGWNEVAFERDCRLFDGIPSRRDFYFVHSYHFVCDDPSAVVARTPYCGTFVSAVRRDGVYGVQFHPEKSQRLGFRVLRNFLSIATC